MSYRFLFYGLLAAVFLPAVSLSLVYLISGTPVVKLQVKTYGYFILALSAGFGTQVGLFQYLREKRRRAVGLKTLTGSGAVSGLTMIACCTHYLAGFLPVLIGTGLLTVVGQWQDRLFWFGLLANFLSLGYLVDQLRKKINEIF